MQEVNSLCMELFFCNDCLTFLSLNDFRVLFEFRDTQLKRYTQVYNQVRKNIKSRICL